MHKLRTEEQKQRRREQERMRGRRRNKYRDQSSENIQKVWLPRTVHGRTLNEEDELLDRLWAVHKPPKA